MLLRARAIPSAPAASAAAGAGQHALPSLAPAAPAALSHRASRRLFSASAAADTNKEEGPVGIVMLNMGGPSSLDGPVDGVEPFLNRLFSDKEIIMLGPLQKWLVRKRAPKIKRSDVGLPMEFLRCELRSLFSSARAQPGSRPAPKGRM
jgi:hypothetical protein